MRQRQGTNNKYGTAPSQPHGDAEADSDSILANATVSARYNVRLQQASAGVSGIRDFNFRFVIHFRV